MSMAIGIAAIGVLSVAAVIDVKTHSIPDVLIVALIAVGIASIGAWSEIVVASRIMGVFIAGAPLLVIAMVREGAFGGGDVKLMAAAGVLLGWQGALVAVILALLGSGAYGAVLLALRSRESEGRLKDRFAAGPFLATSIAAAMLTV
jgi:leader peptidase (prepilin peptidase)/N-methyltransferase